MQSHLASKREPRPARGKSEAILFWLVTWVAAFTKCFCSCTRATFACDSKAITNAMLSRATRLRCAPFNDESTGCGGVFSFAAASKHRCGGRVKYATLEPM